MLIGMAKKLHPHALTQYYTSSVYNNYVYGELDYIH